MTIMTKQDYIDRYMYKSGAEYDKMTKTQLVACIAELANTLQYCGIEFLKPSGDAWDFHDEIRRWCEFNHCKPLAYCNVTENDSRLMNRKKAELRMFVAMVDLACGAMYEVNGEHPCHTFEKNYFARQRRNSRKARG